ncbi:MAG: mercuric ion binding protein [Lentimonas sp.]|jgi:mercuric ion binding protein
MKTLITIAFAFFAMTSFGQSKVEEVKIHTSAECGSCKKRIEGALNYTKGIRFAELDLKTKDVTVQFNSDKITLAEVKSVINKTGYDADESKATKKGYEALPACCQKGGMD